MKEILETYIKSNIAPILIDSLTEVNLPNSVILNANCPKSELNGHYNGTNFEMPQWLKEIKKNKTPTLLIIERIDTISKEEQTKFIEILKYRKVFTFKIPKNTRIIITAKEINKNTINEELYSL